MVLLTPFCSPASHPRAHPVHPLLMRWQSASPHHGRQSACKGAPDTKESESTLKTGQRMMTCQTPKPISSEQHPSQQAAVNTSSVVRISRTHLGLAPAARPLTKGISRAQAAKESSDSEGPFTNFPPRRPPQAPQDAMCRTSERHGPMSCTLTQPCNVLRLLQHGICA